MQGLHLAIQARIPCSSAADYLATTGRADGSVFRTGATVNDGSTVPGMFDNVRSCFPQPCAKAEWRKARASSVQALLWGRQAG